MITASEARKMNKSIKDTEEFKFVMNRMEFKIKQALKFGDTQVTYNFHAMEDQHGNYPSQAMRQAMAEELRANGYRYWEFECMTPNGSINSCFGIAW